VNERQRRWAKTVEPQPQKGRHSRRNSSASNQGFSSDTEAGPSVFQPPGLAPPSSVFASASGPLDSMLMAAGASSTHTSPGILPLKYRVRVTWFRANEPYHIYGGGGGKPVSPTNYAIKINV
jgi:hypothetical protein